MPYVIGVENGSIAGNTELQNGQNLYTSVRRHRRNYIVIGDTLNDTEEDIRTTTGIPLLFSPYLGMYCRSRVPNEISRIKNPRTGVACGLWYVECTWDDEIDPSQDTGEGSDSSSMNLANPCYQRPSIDWDFELDEGILQYDAVTGELVANTAGQPIKVTRPVTIQVLNLTRYEVWPFDPSVSFEYGNTVCDREFWGFPTGVALMMPLISKEEVVSGRMWQKTTYKIKFRLEELTIIVYYPGGSTTITTTRENSWMARPLNEGTRYIDLSDNYIDNMDSHGNPTECNLDLDGHKQPPEDEPYYLEFNRFRKTNFNLLNLEPGVISTTSISGLPPQRGNQT